MKKTKGGVSIPYSSGLSFRDYNTINIGLLDSGSLNPLFIRSQFQSK
jgi:hypothetical protein